MNYNMLDKYSDKSNTEILIYKLNNLYKEILKSATINIFASLVINTVRFLNYLSIICDGVCVIWPNMKYFNIFPEQKK